jgi:hypothetical protein
MEFIILALVTYIAIKGKWLKRIKLSWEESKVATNIDMYLKKYQRMGVFHGDTGPASRSYLEYAKEKRPDLFRGSNGYKYDNISLTPYTLALSAEKLFQDKHPNANAVIAALGMMFLDAQMAAMRIGLGEPDQILLDEAYDIFNPLQQAEADAFDRMMAGNPIKAPLRGRDFS